MLSRSDVNCLLALTILGAAIAFLVPLSIIVTVFWLILK